MHSVKNSGNLKTDGALILPQCLSGLFESWDGWTPFGRGKICWLSFCPIVSVTLIFASLSPCTGVRLHYFRSSNRGPNGLTCNLHRGHFVVQAATNRDLYFGGVWTRGTRESIMHWDALATGLSPRNSPPALSAYLKVNSPLLMAQNIKWKQAV